MKKERSFKEIIEDGKTINLVFLGIGLVLFLLNVSSFIAYSPIEYSFTAFDVSVFSSIVIVLLAVYNLHNK